MFKTLAKISAVALAVGLLAGCATRGQLNEVKDRVSNLESRVSKVESGHNEMMKDIRSAHDHAGRAEEKAEKALECCEAQSEKLDRMFQKRMLK
ncbi:MAG: Lpp/OprI family alanine-zipper lipoprotein [Methylohalobius sp.]|nr:Lpp/OprI family alanine-zipper lipoprotein [Methylohalobius sp.]